METKIQGDAVTIDDWETLQKMTCKKEPITDLVPTLPGYLASELQVKTEPGSSPSSACPATESGFVVTPASTVFYPGVKTEPGSFPWNTGTPVVPPGNVFYQPHAFLQHYLPGTSPVSRQAFQPTSFSTADSLSRWCRVQQEKVSETSATTLPSFRPSVSVVQGKLNSPNAATAGIAISAPPTRTEAVKEVIVIDSDDDDSSRAAHGNAAEGRATGVADGITAPAATTEARTPQQALTSSISPVVSRSPLDSSSRAVPVRSTRSEPSSIKGLTSLVQSVRGQLPVNPVYTAEGRATGITAPAATTEARTPQQARRTTRSSTGSAATTKRYDEFFTESDDEDTHEALANSSSNDSWSVPPSNEVFLTESEDEDAPETLANDSGSAAEETRKWCDVGCRPRRPRHCYSSAQKLQLELEYSRSRYVSSRRMLELAETVGLSQRRIKIWFQNRRMKDKRVEKERGDPHYTGSRFNGSNLKYSLLTPIHSPDQQDKNEPAKKLPRTVRGYVTDERQSKLNSPRVVTSGTYVPPAQPTEARAVKEVVLIDSDDEDTCETAHGSEAESRQTGAADRNTVPPATAVTNSASSVVNHSPPANSTSRAEAVRSTDSGSTSVKGLTPVVHSPSRQDSVNCSATPSAEAGATPVTEVFLTESDAEDSPEAVADSSGKEKSADTGGGSTAAARRRNGDDSGGDDSVQFPGNAESLTATDTDDTRDAFQNNSAEVCPRQSVQRDVVPGTDITPASAQNAHDIPECLGPLYEPVECPVCGDKIRDEHAADQHECFYSSLSRAGYVSTAYLPPSGLKCAFCDAAVYYYPRGFKRHLRKHFTNIYYLCSICEKKFRTKVTFVIHSYSHSGQWPYRCRECGLGCSSLHTLKKHELLHTDQKAAVCEICGDSFKSRQCLARHREKHEGKLYPCTVCNKVYKLSEYLKRHLERHKAAVEPKKYKCDFCENVYRTSQGLIAHKDKYHLKKERVKKYLCNICNKPNKSRTHLETHMTTHTGEKRFTCDICKKKFSTKMAMARHIAEHSGDKNYSCDLCGMKFTQRSSVKRHKGTAHN